MADRPIIFSAPMVLALIAGRKTQTRRILKPEPDNSKPRPGSTMVVEGDDFVRKVTNHFRPRFAVGDRLYARENIIKTVNGIVYAADAGDIFAGAKPKITPCIHMPRAASRMTLIVTEVRVERLKDISEDDAWREGCRQGEPDDRGRPFPAEEPDPSGIGERGWDCARDWFADLWDDINGDGAFDANPWVAAVSFEVIARNIDDLPVPV